MPPHAVLPICLSSMVLIALAIDCAGAHLRAAHAHPPVYTVAQVRAGLAHDARHWLGRSLLVRGVVSATSCEGIAATPVYCTMPGLQDTSAHLTIEPLPLVPQPSDPQPAWLHDLPLLGGLIPAAQTLHWGATGVYRLQLRVETRQYCGTGACYVALVPDAEH